MLKSLFLLTLAAMPLSSLSQLPLGGTDVPIRSQAASDARVSAWFSASVKKAGLSTDVITEKPEGVEYTRRVRSGFGINQQRG